MADTQEITLDRVVLENDESSFTVARFQTAAQLPVTIAGELVGVTDGLPLRLRGQWIEDKKLGKQFKVTSYQLRSPESSARERAP